MNIPIELKGWSEWATRQEKRTEDALVIAQEFAKGYGVELRKLSESIESLKNSSSMPSDFAQRLTLLETQFAELHRLMTEQSPATKKTKLSKFGRMVAGQRVKGGGG